MPDLPDPPDEQHEQFVRDAIEIDLAFHEGRLDEWLQEKFSEIKGAE